MTKTRLEAFTDGVFAIVITLLILNIHLPETDNSELGQAIKDLMPNILAYVMSFILIGLYWMAHHTSFQNIARIDGRFIWLNIILMLFVSFMPFPAYLLGKYPMEKVPLMIYGINLIMANLMAFLMTLYIAFHPELATETFTFKDFKKQFPIYIVVNGLYLVAILIAPFAPYVSYAIYIIVALALAFFYARMGVQK